MGAVSITTTEAKDQRAAIEGGVGQFAAPEGIIANPNSQVVSLSPHAKMTSSVTGLAGQDINQLFSTIFAEEAADREQVRSLTGQAFSTIAGLAETAQMQTTADWQKWLPYIVIGAVLIIYLGAKR